MKILVTGGAGFIGSALVRYLVNELDMQVVNVDCLTYAGNIESLGPAAFAPNHILLKTDICSRQDLDSIFGEHRPDAVLLTNELGWKPEESFETGLEKTVRWYMTNRDWWQRVLDGSYRLARIGMLEAHG